MLKQVTSKVNSNHYHTAEHFSAGKFWVLEFVCIFLLKYTTHWHCSRTSTSPGGGCCYKGFTSTGHHKYLLRTAWGTQRNSPRHWSSLQSLQILMQLRGLGGTILSHRGPAWQDARREALAANVQVGPSVLFWSNISNIPTQQMVLMMWLFNIVCVVNQICVCIHCGYVCVYTHC